jgi:hypothetical protein
MKIPEGTEVEVMYQVIKIDWPARLHIPEWAFFGEVTRANDEVVAEFAVSPRHDGPIATMTVDTNAPFLLHMSSRCELVDVTTPQDERRAYLIAMKADAGPDKAFPQ